MTLSLKQPTERHFDTACLVHKEATLRVSWGQGLPGGAVGGVHNLHKVIQHCRTNTVVDVTGLVYL